MKSLRFVFFLIGLCLIATVAWAQVTGEPGNEVTLAGYAVPFLLSLVLGIIYKLLPVINDRYKTPLAMIVGVILSIAAMFYNKEAGTPLSGKMWIDFILYGVMLGASATGLYELQRSVRKPRS